MIDPEHPEISVARQCRLLGLPRSSYYHSPQPLDAPTQALMVRIDKLYLERPTLGSRGIARQLRREGVEVGRKRVRRLMRLMRLEAIYQRPRTSQSNPQHRVYPYLLRDVAVTRPNQVWATDITYIPVRGGYVYLCAVIDWYSRAVLAWRLSSTMEADFCVEALQEALAKYGCPEIFNSDQGSQFTSELFTGTLLKEGIRISMDGKGRCLDNVFVERLWRTLKYEEVYLMGYENLREAHRSLRAYLEYYNNRRGHSALPGECTPMEAYRPKLLEACGQ